MDNDATAFAVAGLVGDPQQRLGRCQDTLNRTAVGLQASLLQLPPECHLISQWHISITDDVDMNF